ncbi:hypothetical protein [Nocardia sp. SSK8]
MNALAAGDGAGPAARIADSAGLTSTPDSGGRVRGRIRRMAVTVRHARS